MRLLSPKIHGIIDYLTVGVLALAPVLFMPGELTPAINGCLALTGGLLLLSLMTRYPLGLARVVPFPVHGAFELIGAPLIVAYPWIRGFADVPAARNFYVVVGVAVFLLWLITDYRAAERDARR